MTGTTVAARRPRIFRGWWVLAGIFLAMTMGSGFAFYAQGVFLDALVAEQGFSVGMAGAGTGTFFVVSGISGYFAGDLMSRYDIRAVMVFGSTVAAIGILLLGQIRNEWQMFAVFILYGGGYALAGLVPATSLVTRWFHVKRSIALSIASTGLSVGGIAITPFIGQVIDERSLEATAPTLALVYWLGMVPITLLLLRPSPEALGLRPDGQAALAKGQTEAAVPGMAFAEAIKTRYFRVLSAAFILVMGAQVGAIQHIFKLTKDAVDLEAAQLALVVVTSTSVVSRLLGGLAATRFSLGLLTSVLIIVQAIGLAAIGLAEQRVTILIGVFILGAAMGNLLMLHPLLLADTFGVRDYPRIYGLGALLMVTGVGLGPFVVGLIRDASSYRSAYLTMSGVALVGLLIFRTAGQAPNYSTPDAGDIEGLDAAFGADAAPPVSSRPEPDVDERAVEQAEPKELVAVSAAKRPSVGLGDGVVVVPLLDGPPSPTGSHNGDSPELADSTESSERVERSNLAVATKPSPAPDLIPPAPSSEASDVRSAAAAKPKVVAAVSAAVGLAVLGWVVRRIRSRPS